MGTEISKEVYEQLAKQKIIEIREKAKKEKENVPSNGIFANQAAGISEGMNSEYFVKNALDTNFDGTVTEEELTKFFMEVDKTPTDPNMGKFFTGDGNINDFEILAYRAKFNQERLREKLKQARSSKTNGISEETYTKALKRIDKLNFSLYLDGSQAGAYNVTKSSPKTNLDKGLFSTLAFKVLAKNEIALEDENKGRKIFFEHLAQGEVGVAERDGSYITASAGKGVKQSSVVKLSFADARPKNLSVNMINYPVIVSKEYPNGVKYPLLEKSLQETPVTYTTANLEPPLPSSPFIKNAINKIRNQVFNKENISKLREELKTNDPEKIMEIMKRLINESAVSSGYKDRGGELTIVDGGFASNIPAGIIKNPFNNSELSFIISKRYINQVLEKANPDVRLASIVNIIQHEFTHVMQLQLISGKVNKSELKPEDIKLAESLTKQMTIPLTVFASIKGTGGRSQYAGTGVEAQAFANGNNAESEVRQHLNELDKRLKKPDKRLKKPDKRR